jgi:hypothetical protein
LAFAECIGKNGDEFHQCLVEQLTQPNKDVEVLAFSDELIKEAALCIDKGYVTPFTLDTCFKKNKNLSNLFLTHKEAEVLHQEGARMNARKAQKIRDAQKQEHFQELFARCVSYGFEGDKNIAACIQREAQHELQLARMEQRLNSLEDKIVSNQKGVEEKPLLLEILSVLADEADRQNEMEDRVRLYKLESKVNTINSRNNTKQANCTLNRNC